MYGDERAPKDRKPIHRKFTKKDLTNEENCDIIIESLERANE